MKHRGHTQEFAWVRYLQDDDGEQKRNSTRKRHIYTRPGCNLLRWETLQPATELDGDTVPSYGLVALADIIRRDFVVPNTAHLQWADERRQRRRRKRARCRGSR